MSNTTVKQLKIGDKAPDFTLKAYPDKTVSLKDYLNTKNVVLAFYPKDDTPGCTKEMCLFSENLPHFETHNTEVLGISLDNIASHGKFAGKYSLKQTLLADESGNVAKLYGVLPDGKTTSNRVLFIINKSGIIVNIIEGMPDTQELIKNLESIK